MDLKADNWFSNLDRWSTELARLRNIMIECGLEESLKWGRPCYSFNGELVTSISGFKNHYGVWFFQGVFLKDKNQLLINAQEGKTKAMRQMRFDDNHKPDLISIKSYVEEARENARLGMKVKAGPKKTRKIAVELKEALERDEDLKKLYHALSTGKKNEFNEYILEAKREATKMKRLEKIIPMIRHGEGLNDRYR